MAKFVQDRVENIIEKGENAGKQHFLSFPHGFLQFTLSGSLTVGIVWKRVKKFLCLK